MQPISKPNHRKQTNPYIITSENSVKDEEKQQERKSDREENQK